MAQDAATTLSCLYGNCQAGWAVALLAAHCRGLTGPTVLNGSPLSYWAGASDVNPMRLAGGLLGGSWLLDLITDLADGRLDGAWLVQNFENLKSMHRAERFADRGRPSAVVRYFPPPRSRSALVMTETELRLIASAAIIGDNSLPVNGYSSPAASGMPRAL